MAIDEFGFDRIERSESSQAASLLYKVVDGRTKRSTAMVTNISFEAWAEYLGDAPLAMAVLDRVVDGAIILKIEGRSYRASRAQAALAPQGRQSGEGASQTNAVNTWASSLFARKSDASALHASG